NPPPVLLNKVIGINAKHIVRLVAPKKTGDKVDKSTIQDLLTVVIFPEVVAGRSKGRVQDEFVPRAWTYDALDEIAVDVSEPTYIRAHVNVCAVCNKQKRNKTSDKETGSKNEPRGGL